MIGKIIQRILAEDETDTTEASALLDVQKYNPSVSSISGEEWRWQSLKTLLGDSSLTWSERKIKFINYSEREDDGINGVSSLPLIQIYSPQSWICGENIQGEGNRMKTSVTVGVEAPPHQVYSNLAYNLIRRVYLDLTCPVYGSGARQKKEIKNLDRYGISRIEIVPNYIDPSKANRMSASFSVNFTEY